MHDISSFIICLNFWHIPYEALFNIVKLIILLSHAYNQEDNVTGFLGSSLSYRLGINLFLYLFEQEKLLHGNDESS